MAMTEPMRNPTLEAIEGNANKTAAYAKGIKEGLYALLNDLGYGEPSSAGKGESPEQSAIIGRICDRQNDGLEILSDCERLVGEVRRQLFSVPINAKSPLSSGETGLGRRIA